MIDVVPGRKDVKHSWGAVVVTIRHADDIRINALGTESFLKIAIHENVPDDSKIHEYSGFFSENKNLSIVFVFFMTNYTV